MWLERDFSLPRWTAHPRFPSCPGSLRATAWLPLGFVQNRLVWGSENTVQEEGRDDTLHLSSATGVETPWQQDRARHSHAAVGHRVPWSPFLLSQLLSTGSSRATTLPCGDQSGRLMLELLLGVQGSVQAVPRCSHSSRHAFADRFPFLRMFSSNRRTGWSLWAVTQTVQAHLLLGDSSHKEAGAPAQSTLPSALTRQTRPAEQ